MILFRQKTRRERYADVAIAESQFQSEAKKINKIKYKCKSRKYFHKSNDFHAKYDIKPTFFQEKPMFSLTSTVLTF